MGLRGEYFVQIDVRGGPGRSEGVPGAISAAQTPQIDDLRSVKKSHIKNPGVVNWAKLLRLSAEPLDDHGVL